MSGFLGKRERLKEVLLEDDNAVKELGLTHKQIADRLDYFQQRYQDWQEEKLRGDWVPVDDKYEVTRLQYLGVQECPWGDDQTSADIIVVNKETNQEIRYSGLASHLIREHHFYEGKEVEYRTDPKRIVELLGASPGVRISTGPLVYSPIEICCTILDTKSMLTHYRWLHKIHNQSSIAISTLTHSIVTDVPVESLHDLHVRVYNEKGVDLAITTLRLDRPHHKEFDISLSGLLEPGRKQRYYVEYDVEEPERYFEYHFRTNCSTFRMQLKYPNDGVISRPVVYEINPITSDRAPSRVKSRFAKLKDHTVMHWTKSNIQAGESLRFKW